jgi:hypothetical protein
LSSGAGIVSGNSGAWARAAFANSIAAAKGSANLINPANLIDVGGVSATIRP